MDGNITAFYGPTYFKTIDLDSSAFLPSFIETIAIDDVYFIEDISLSEYWNIDVGNIVLVEESVDISAQGKVVSKDPVNTSNVFNYRLIVRFDSNSTDIELDGQNIWLLPYQGEKDGK